MTWDGVVEFGEMGGLGLYVWGAYAMVCVALAWDLLLLVQRHRRALDDASEAP